MKTNPSTRYEVNFHSLLRKMRLDLQNWPSLTLTWFGWCNAFKMSMLPKLLYFIQTLTMHLPKSGYLHLLTIVRYYIWGKHCQCFPFWLSQRQQVVLVCQVLKNTIEHPIYLRSSLGVPGWALSHRPWLNKTILLYISVLAWLPPSTWQTLRSHPMMGLTFGVERKTFSLSRISPALSPLL